MSYASGRLVDGNFVYHFFVSTLNRIQLVEASDVKEAISIAEKNLKSVDKILTVRIAKEDEVKQWRESEEFNDRMNSMIR